MDLVNTKTSSFQLRVVLKPRLSLCPITKDMDNPMNYSKLEVNKCSWHEVQENVCELVMIGFGATCVIG